MSEDVTHEDHLDIHEDVQVAEVEVPAEVEERLSDDEKKEDEEVQGA